MTDQATASPGTEKVVPVADATATATTTADTTTTTAAVAAADAKPAATTPAADTLVAKADTADTTTQVVPADWPADWREKLAGEDKKTLERLGRLQSPADLFKSYRALEQRVSSGELKRSTPPDNASPEQLAEWRKEQGIPEAPDGYKIELPSGIVLGEADRPVVDSFTKAVHEKGWDSAKVNDALAWYYTEQERQQAARAAADLELHQKADAELKGEWGPEFTPNLTSIKNLMAAWPEGAEANFWGGRLADGTKIGDSPAVLKWLAGIQRELDPMHTRLPNNPGGGLTNRLEEIRQLRRDDPDKYDSDKALQAEELKLLEIDTKLKSRGRAA
jgi:hypothetical protein